MRERGPQRNNAKCSLRGHNVPFELLQDPVQGLVQGDRDACGCCPVRTLRRLLCSLLDRLARLLNKIVQYADTDIPEIPVLEILDRLLPSSLVIDLAEFR